MTGSVVIPKISTRTKFNEVKKPEVSSIDGEKLVIRFCNYLEKKCGIATLNVSQSKKVIGLMKNVSEKTLKDVMSDSRSCGCECIALTPGGSDEYTKLFNCFRSTEIVVEFKTGGTSRVFGFFLGGEEGREPPSFNIVLISEQHLDSTKVKR